MSDDHLHVLFVCLGNICRSPAAEGVFRAKAEAAGVRLKIDSAGTGAWHVGSPPDERMIAAARRRGYDLTPIRARQVDIGDFYVCDHILAMDTSNLNDLQELAPSDGKAAVTSFLTYGSGGDVPDPYYGGERGFDQVLDLIEEAADGFLRSLTGT